METTPTTDGQVIDIEAKPVVLTVFDAEWRRLSAEGLNRHMDRLANLPEDMPLVERLQIRVDAQQEMLNFAINSLFTALSRMDDRYEPKKQAKPRAKKVGAKAVAATAETPGEERLAA